MVNFDTCIKCTLCWLQCPDSCFDVTPEGLYDANMEACCGCGVCEAVCPVKECVTMVNEIEFHDNASQWEEWRKEKTATRFGWKRRSNIRRSAPTGSVIVGNIRSRFLKCSRLRRKNSTDSQRFL